MTNLLKRTLALLCTLALLLSALPMSLAAEPDSAEFAILYHGYAWQMLGHKCSDRRHGIQ